MGIKALLLCVKGSLCNLSVYVYSASKRKEKKKTNSYLVLDHYLKHN